MIVTITMRASAPAGFGIVILTVMVIMARHRHPAPGLLRIATRSPIAVQPTRQVFRVVIAMTMMALSILGRLRSAATAWMRTVLAVWIMAALVSILPPAPGAMIAVPGRYVLMVIADPNPLAYEARAAQREAQQIQAPASKRGLVEATVMRAVTRPITSVIISSPVSTQAMESPAIRVSAETTARTASAVIMLNVSAILSQGLLARTVVKTLSALLVTAVAVLARVPAFRMGRQVAACRRTVVHRVSAVQASLE
mgnify:CR=1 FL=1